MQSFINEEDGQKLAWKSTVINQQSKNSGPGVSIPSPVSFQQFHSIWKYSFITILESTTHFYHKALVLEELLPKFLYFFFFFLAFYRYLFLLGLSTF